MKKEKAHFHGSDIEKVEEIYGIPKEEIIRFSSNVNPLGISPHLRSGLAEHIDIISTYPDRNYTELREAIGNYTNTPIENIIVGNGSTEIISSFIKMYHPSKAMILAPTYSEYQREIELNHGSCEYYVLKEEDDYFLNTKDLIASLREDLDVLVICNPNNPTSSIISSKDMELILADCSKKGIFVMIDETYIEFISDPEPFTSIPLIEKFDNFIVLRGISKFFAAPGLRLGYGITGNKTYITQINSLKNPWTINSLAAISAPYMFEDREYILTTQNLISSEEKRIRNRLKDNSNYKLYPSFANFILVKILNPSVTAHDLFELAIKNGCMIRDCSSFQFLNSQFIRFCIMLPEQNDKLLSVLESV